MSLSERLDKLEQRRKVDPRDGPVARIDSQEWLAWQKYYIDQGRSFSAQLQRQYKFQGWDWPVLTQWPPNITGDDL